MVINKIVSLQIENKLYCCVYVIITLPQCNIWPQAYQVKYTNKLLNLFSLYNLNVRVSFVTLLELVFLTFSVRSTFKIHGV